jgi:diguanylate cyclase (GGDEF)-like protein
MARLTRMLPFRDKTQAAVYLLAAALFVLAGIAMLLTPDWYVAAPTGVNLPWWALLLGFGAAQLMAFNLEMRHQTHLVTFTELPLVLGLVFQSPLVVLGSRVFGSLIVLAIRNRASFTKLVFNAANLSVDAAVALAVYRGIVGVAVPSSPAHWLGLGLAVIVANLLTTLAVTAVIAINVGSTRQLLTGSMLRIQALVVVTLTALGILIAQTALTLPFLAVALLSVFMVVYLGVRQYTTLTIRHSQLLAIQEFSRNVGRRLGLEVLAGEILTQARGALIAESATLLVLEGGDAFDAKAYQLSDGGSSTRMLLPHLPTEWSALTADSGPILFECGTASDFQASFSGCVLVAPIEAGSLRALLVVENREGQLRSFDDSDVQLMSALATHANSVFDNGLLLHSLGEQAVTDSLTGLPNKRHLDERIQAEVLRFHGDGSFSLLLVDLNDFKEVNDTLGHAVGDQLLQIVGMRFSEVCPEGGFVARIGGDEFAMLLPGAGHDEAVHAVQALSAALAQPVELGAMSLSVRASAGIAVAPEDGLTPDLLLRRADVAMYSAKRSQAAWRRYDPAVDTHSPRRLAIAGHLPEAIATGALRLEYQPKMVVANRSITSVEALARWDHPEFGGIAPTEFISIAEQAGVIHQLTEFVLNTALAQVRVWRDQGIDLRVAVNLSVRDVLEGDLAELVSGVLDLHELPASCLTLELTETILLPVNADALEVLEDLRSMGIRIALDDFGTGYSSMGYLRHLPVDEIKIDKSFIMDLPLRERDQLIVRAIVDLGHHLGVEVTAEGVESQRCLGLVGELGCDQIQGFLLTRSLSPEDLLHWLSDDGEQMAGASWPTVLHLPERHLRLA